MSKTEESYYPLAMKVIAAAKQGDALYDWAAYIKDVPGNNHYKEYKQVLRRGTKLPYEVAKVLFPDFDRKYKWRS